MGARMGGFILIWVEIRLLSTQNTTGINLTLFPYFCYDGPRLGNFLYLNITKQVYLRTYQQHISLFYIILTVGIFDFMQGTSCLSINLWNIITTQQWVCLKLVPQYRAMSLGKCNTTWAQLTWQLRPAGKRTRRDHTDIQTHTHDVGVPVQSTTELLPGRYNAWKIHGYMKFWKLIFRTLSNGGKNNRRWWF